MSKIDKRVITILTIIITVSLLVIGLTSCKNKYTTTEFRLDLADVVETGYSNTVDGETTLYYSPYIMLSEYKNVVLEDKNPFKMKLFNSYEEACEVTIKYCLEHLI